MGELIELVLHADVAIGEFTTYGMLIYLILFSIIFIETGLVVVTFFPGDGLLFSTGMMPASGELNFSILFLLLSVATILGNTSNYLIGKFLGVRFFTKEKSERNHYLKKAFIYYGKNAIQAIFVSQFISFLLWQELLP
jgi:membrane-associated protein